MTTLTTIKSAEEMMRKRLRMMMKKMTKKMMKKEREVVSKFPTTRKAGPGGLQARQRKTTLS